MLGYIVQSINVSQNKKNLDKLQHELLSGVTIGDMELVYDTGEGFSHYQCSYQAGSNLNVELVHLFYHLSEVME